MLASYIIIVNYRILFLTRRLFGALGTSIIAVASVMIHGILLNDCGIFTVSADRAIRLQFLLEIVYWHFALYMIFEDASQLRWRITLGVLATLVTAGVVVAIVWVASILINPSLGILSKKSQDRAIAMRQADQILRADVGQRTAAHTPTVTPARVPKVLPPHIALPSVVASTTLEQFKHGPFLSTAFLVQDDPDSVQSFQDHSSALDIVFPDWYFVTKNTCDVSERADPDITAIIKNAKQTAIFPRITNGDKGVWYGSEISAMLKDPEMRDCVVTTLAQFAKQAGVPGVNVDFENLSPEDRDNYLEFLDALANALHANNQLVTVDLPVNDPAYDMEYSGKITDGVILMAYDEHYPGGDPGAIASDSWFEDAVDAGVGAVPPKKLVIALGTYGYDWTIGTTTPAQSLKFSEVMAKAQDVGAEPELDHDTRNMSFSYQDDSGQTHEVWFLNGVTAWNEWKKISNRGVLGVGWWRLGTEDPSIWKLYQQNASGNVFATAPPLTTVQYLSTGELFHLQSSPQAGKLDITLDDDGSIDYALYTTIPTGYVLERVGRDIPPKSVVLSFDDGPDPTWTPQILSILEYYHVPATFMVVGDQAQRYPELLARMAHDGFIIGNHTYLHPDISTISSRRLQLELNKTQRVIESAFGRKTILFRPPYDTDSAPSTPAQLDAIANVSSYGYSIFGANIDTDDWQQPGIDHIVQQVMRGVANPDNHVIVMHDAGGNRSQTVAALKIIIPQLQAQGYSFMDIATASGLNKATINPSLDSNEWFFIEATTIVSAGERWGWALIVWLFRFTTFLSLIRILFLGTTVVRSARRSSADRFPGSAPDFVSILIPAYNEERTITQTIRSIQGGNYQKFEILVINDGSTDKTAAVVEALAHNDKRIRLITQPNAGKAVALNRGFTAARADIVVTIDADTIFSPTTLNELLRPFADATVDAVCGNVEVGNIHNLLTGFQALEYITTQNFDRRAFDEFNCISVVPGATGAWRKAKVQAIGGYLDDTLTEDAELTLRLLRAGGKIVYPARARSLTEVPETVAALARQRFRWSYGTFQCLWKNRDQFFKGSMGWIALPNMFLFQILFPILSPVGDLVFLLSLLRGDVAAVALGYCLFLAMDVGGSLLAFTLEQRPRKLMWLILIQRFFYRQFMYVITYRALLAALHGKKQGWNKLERSGYVLYQPKVPTGKMQS